MASPEFRRALRSISAWASQARTPDGGLDLAGLRDATDGGFLAMPADIAVSQTRVGARPGEWVTGSHSDPDARILYLHGGGYLAGGLASHRPFVCALARQTGCSCLQLDYRLAPEHPFPAAVDDAIVAYQTIFATGPRGHQPARCVFVVGDSAGGGLTLATLVAARDRNFARATAAVTMSAYTDCAFTGDSIRTRADQDPVIGVKMLPEAVAMYLDGHDPKHPLASPLYADLTDLPPLLMQVGDAEILRDDTTRFGERARRAGVDVTVEVWPEMTHNWHLFLGIFPEAQQAIDRICTFIRRFV